MCCTLWTYSNDIATIAALLAFRDRRTRHFYTTWHDSAFGELSPGQALLFEATAQTLSEALDADYMTGESLYKKRLATDVVPLFRVDARPEDVAQLASERMETVRQTNAA
jgi:CelD/BcsL family acetyltransferase involved in cellulose biosynthesis